MSSGSRRPADAVGRGRTNGDGGTASAPPASIRPVGLGAGAAGGRPVAHPLYLQIKDHLIRRVLADEWRPGECIPSETKLAEAYGVSQGTVRRAIEEMAVDGLVTRHPGRGTFVTSHQGDYQPFRFHRLYDDTGARVVGNELTYVSCRKAKASPRAARGLQIKGKSPVTEIVRLRRLDGRPILLQFIVLRADLCPDADAILGQKKPNSVYLALEETYNLLIVRVDERLRARIAAPEEVDLLRLTPGTPVLEIERVAYSLGGEPVEWRTAVYHTENLHYWNRIG